MKKKLITILILAAVSLTFSTTVHASAAQDFLNEDFPSTEKYDEDYIPPPTESYYPADPITGQPTESDTNSDTDTGYSLKEQTFDIDILGSDQDFLNEKNEDGSENESPIVAFLLRIINFALTVIGSIAILVLIIGGFMLMVAQGNQQKLDEAKDVIKYAIIGLIVTFLSYIIVIFVQSLFITSESEQSTETSSIISEIS